MKHINRLRINCFQFLGVVLFLVPIVCTAEIVLVGPDQVSIPLPIGHCILQEHNSVHYRLLKYLKDANEGLNKLLYVSADCEQLRNWELGRVLLNDFTNVVAPIHIIDKKIDIRSDQYVSMMKKMYAEQGMEIFEKKVGSWEDKANHLLKEFGRTKIDETKLLGILSSDRNALYLGMIQNLTTETGGSKIQAGVVALLSVNGKIISMNLYTEYRGTATVNQLLNEVKDWASRVQDAN